MAASTRLLGKQFLKNLIPKIQIKLNPITRLQKKFQRVERL